MKEFDPEKLTREHVLDSIGKAYDLLGNPSKMTFSAEEIDTTKPGDQAQCSRVGRRYMAVEWPDREASETPTSWPGYPPVESLPSCSAVEPGAKVRFIVQLTRDSYLLPALGPCGKTTVESSAKRYRSSDRAVVALLEARKYHPFANARILCLSEGLCTG